MAIQVRLDPAKTYQHMEGFGASGAWWAQVVGGWEGNPVREEIARLLFSKKDGIGLMTYRYNLGGGSKRSGKGQFPNPERRADAFDDGETGYDWNRDSEAVLMLREAVRQGAEEVVFFVNSPPERWTVTGRTQDKFPFSPNLRKDCEADFTRYVLDVTEHFLAEGLPVKFISPINEPMGLWIGKSGQEGCFYRPSGMRRLLRRFADEMERRPALKDVKLSGTENNDLRMMNKTYTRALMKDPAIRARVDGVDVHGYCFPPLRFLKDVKRRFRKYMDRRYPGVPLRMTEWTEMRGGRDCGMTSALVQAGTMYEDLSVLNVISWQHWIAVSQYDFCDGLIYIDADAQTYSIPKRYYAFGNFSKFIPRGALRVSVETPGAPACLQSLAFTAEDKTTYIFINHGQMPLELALPGQTEEAEMFVTSEDRSLESEQIKTGAFTLPGKSVCTVII